jgi:hypothetical protein
MPVDYVIHKGMRAFRKKKRKRNPLPRHAAQGNEMLAMAVIGPSPRLLDP